MNTSHDGHRIIVKQYILRGSCRPGKWHGRVFKIMSKINPTASRAHARHAFRGLSNVHAGHNHRQNKFALGGGQSAQNNQQNTPCLHEFNYSCN